MTREIRTLFLAGLTLVIYAVSIFLDKGAFLFPFPLNEVLFLAISIQFFYWNRRPIAPGIISILAGLLWVLSNQFFWEIILPHEQTASFLAGSTTDWLLTAFYTILLIAGSIASIRQKSLTGVILGVLFASLLVFSILWGEHWALLAALVCMTTSVLIKPTFVPYHLLWPLLLFLEATKWISLVVN